MSHQTSHLSAKEEPALVNASAYLKIGSTCWFRKLKNEISLSNVVTEMYTWPYMTFKWMVSGKIPLEQILLQRSVFCNKNVSVYWKEHIAHKPCHLVTVDDILLYAYTIGTMLDHKFPFCPLSFQYSYFITKKKMWGGQGREKTFKNTV